MEKIGFLAWYRFDDIESITTRNKLKNFYVPISVLLIESEDRHKINLINRFPLKV